MKKTIIGIALGIGLILPVLQSCDKWLEATSSSQISDEQLFATRSGFHEALSGIYLNMGSTAAYGADYTYLVNDLVCFPYVSVANNSLYRMLQQHQYTNSTASTTLSAGVTTLIASPSASALSLSDVNSKFSPASGDTLTTIGSSGKAYIRAEKSNEWARRYGGSYNGSSERSYSGVVLPEGHNRFYEEGDED